MAAWRPFANGKRDRGEPDDAGYYSLQESPGDPWAARLEEIDRYLDAEREKPKGKHSRWWWFSQATRRMNSASSAATPRLNHHQRECFRFGFSRSASR